ncbi:hypothetical protein GCM10027022_19390 [Alpinimonas psychrophila]|uniref:Uncharacterized protein n=1 Tax=Alpinimonas psychrophila TaxID=748908 RepID=A0A7W3PP29_9MICO|nr:hypothetical protein [Alpinimonas psychrophila]MBA8829489.1 hypothetical protein [Alpinimonas psychrophila]
MTWTKLSDDFTDDTWTLSDAAYRSHSEGLVWSNRKLLDLRIPKDDVRRFKNPEAIGELLAGGWWIDQGAYYLIQHHAAYQRLREAVINQQKVNKENRAKGGQASPPPREQTPVFKTPNDSSNKPLNDSSNEMDRTGRASYVKSSEEAETVNTATGEIVTAPYVASALVTEWPVVTIPNSTPSDFDTCRVCDNKLASAPSRASGLCRKGDDQHQVFRASHAA